MANQATTTYKVTGTRKAVNDLWSTLQKMEVNSKNIWLYQLAEYYGIDYEAKKVFVFDIDHSVTDGKYSVTMDYLGAYPVGGSNPESVCIDRVHSCMWVGDDYGDTSYLYRYDFTGFDDFDKN